MQILRINAVPTAWYGNLTSFVPVFMFSPFSIEWISRADGGILITMSIEWPTTTSDKVLSFQITQKLSSSIFSSFIWCNIWEITSNRKSNSLTVPSIAKLLSEIICCLRKLIIRFKVILTCVNLVSMVLYLHKFYRLLQWRIDIQYRPIPRSPYGSFACLSFEKHMQSRMSSVLQRYGDR